MLVEPGQALEKTLGYYNTFETSSFGSIVKLQMGNTVKHCISDVLRQTIERKKEIDICWQKVAFRPTSGNGFASKKSFRKIRKRRK